jgi:DNA polymerase III subunit delta
MILKSYSVEQNIEILKNYKATLIYGENSGIKDDIKEEIKKRNKKSEILTFFESDILKDTLLYDQIANQSLFTQEKVIFIQNSSDKILEQISESLEREYKDVQIYVFAENLDKKSKLRSLFEKNKNLAIFACYEDTERTLITYINKELQDFKGLTGEIVNLIISNSSQNRKIIKNELIKIKNYFLDKKINKEKIEEILNIKNDKGFEEIRDKALIGEKDKINELLSSTTILNEDAFFYLNTLNYRIMRLHKIVKGSEENKDYEQMIDNLKPPVFWKDRPIILKQLKKWDLKKLEKTIVNIGKTEILMKKNSHLRNDIIIKELLVNLATEASSSY